jgi:hypothetical protein
MNGQGGWADGRCTLEVGRQGFIATWTRLQNALQGDGLAKIEPIAQFLPNILCRLDSLHHGVFGQKTHQGGAVEVGTRKGACHGGGIWIQKNRAAML